MVYNFVNTQAVGQKGKIIMADEILVETDAQVPSETESVDSVMVLRNISKEQAKQEVQKLLITSSKPLDHGEIADELRLDLRLVAQVCAELIREGVIEFV